MDTEADWKARQVVEPVKGIQLSAMEPGAVARIDTRADFTVHPSRPVVLPPLPDRDDAIVMSRFADSEEFEMGQRSVFLLSFVSEVIITGAEKACRSDPIIAQTTCYLIRLS